MVNRNYFTGLSFLVFAFCEYLNFSFMGEKMTIYSLLFYKNFKLEHITNCSNIIKICMITVTEISASSQINSKNFLERDPF